MLLIDFAFLQRYFGNIIHAHNNKIMKKVVIRHISSTNNRNQDNYIKFCRDRHVTFAQFFVQKLTSFILYSVL